MWHTDGNFPETVKVYPFTSSLFYSENQKAKAPDIIKNFVPLIIK